MSCKWLTPPLNLSTACSIIPVQAVSKGMLASGTAKDWVVLWCQPLCHGSLVVPAPLPCARGWHHETRIGTGNQLHHTIIISMSFYGTVAHHLEGKLLLCEGYVKKLLQN